MGSDFGFLIALVVAPILVVAGSAAYWKLKDARGSDRPIPNPLERIRAVRWRRTLAGFADSAERYGTSLLVPDSIIPDFADDALLEEVDLAEGIRATLELAGLEAPILFDAAYRALRREAEDRGLTTGEPS